jgi:hypothetical protein
MSEPSYILFPDLRDAWQIHGPAEPDGSRPWVATYGDAELAQSACDAHNAAHAVLERLKENSPCQEALPPDDPTKHVHATARSATQIKCPL